MNLIKKVLKGEKYYTVGYRKRSSYKKGEYKSIPISSRFWYADPILFEWNNSTYIFMEIFDKKKGRGGIGFSKFDKAGNLSKPEMILEEQFHMSFPNIFIYNKTIYMIPETSESKKLYLYKCKNFPYDWEIADTIENRQFQVDTSLIKLDGHWYSISSDFNPNDVKQAKDKIELFNIKNDKIILKPSDLKFGRKKEYDYTSRNGGICFYEKDRAYRVVQISNEFMYGVSVEIRELMIKEKNVLSEKAINILDINNCKFDLKNRELIGIHTYGKCTEYEVVDISFYFFSVQELLYRIKAKWNSIIN